MFYLSDEDDLLRGLQSRTLAAIPARLRRRADGQPAGPALDSLIDGVQRRAEVEDAKRRRDQLAVERPEGAQRSGFYALRDSFLHSTDLAAEVRGLLGEVVAEYVGRYADPERLLDALAELYAVRLHAEDLAGHPGSSSASGNESPLRHRVAEDAQRAYRHHEEFVGAANQREAERTIVFRVLDRSWREHLEALAALRSGLSGGPDDLARYEAEAERRYTIMLRRAKEDIVRYCLHTEIGQY
jgi:preprotein translocase subunit SecA